MKCCPACGQTLPLDAPPGLHLTPGHSQIYEAVRKAGPNGISADRLFNKLYENDPDGGPLTGKGCLTVRIWHLNKKLKPFGFMIRAPKGPSTIGYTLRKFI